MAPRTLTGIGPARYPGRVPVRLSVLAVPFALALCGPLGPAAAGAPLSSEERTWPAARAVLEVRCLPCHGADGASKSALSFATRATFLAGGMRGSPLSSELAESRLLAVVSYRDPDLAMPPDGLLPEGERAALERWVLDGAPWPEGAEGRLAPDPSAHETRAEAGADWWAYRPLERPALPAVHDAPELHPVDAFLRARRDTAGLGQAPRAGDDTLLRRASFDLTGLPPMPEERARFASETAELGHRAAWERLLDRLLASPHHGEHAARAWLDLVRYAETNGYERDAAKRNIWRYRDWVVRAFDRDLPYDRFVLEQLAGDELLAAEPSLGGDALLATGYYRLGVWDDEPADPEQARADELADIVDTTAQVFLATTMGCARCHDHKADPITQRDYYALTAWFNNLQGYGGDAFGQHLGGGMLRDVADAEGSGVWDPDELEREVERVTLELGRAAEGLDIRPPDRAALAERRQLVVDARAPLAERARWRWLAGPAPDGWERPGFQDTGWLEGQGAFTLPGAVGELFGTSWNTRRIHLRTSFFLESIPATLSIAFRHDEDLVVFLNGQSVLSREGHRGDYEELELPGEARDALVVGRNLLAVACRQTVGHQYVDVGLFTGPPLTGPGDWLAELREHLKGAREEPSAQPALALLAERDRLAAAPRAAPHPALVASEFGPAPPEQRVLLRGSVHAPGDVVAPGVPAAFAARAPAPAVPAPAMRGSSTGRRLALARWIVGEGRFLSARVAANRLWQAAFGRGICPTPGDFGRSGQPPTHPELLDWLAVELVERDWSLKSMRKLLMASEAYKRASTPADGALERDPENRLFTHRDPLRLTAEQYRDAVLATSGALNLERFGPSVFPPLPPAVIQTSSQPHNAWGRSTPEQAARRSLYVHVKRSLRPPLLEALDQPDPDLPCPARFPTNVPTQALMTLNGAFVNGAAADLAERLSSEADDLAGRIARGVELCLARIAEPDEIERGVAFVDGARAEHGLDEGGALRLFCLALYNRNEFLWLD